MKYSHYTVILLLFWKSTFPQQNQDSVSFKVRYALTNLNHISSLGDNMITGEFAISDGFGGYSYIFQESGKFKRREFSCLGDYYSDSGHYEINRHGEVLLVPGSRKTKYLLYRFDKFAFLIATSKIEKFKEDFRNLAEVMYKSNRKIQSNAERYTEEFFIALGLGKRYLTKLE